eukprot:1009106_1
MSRQSDTAGTGTSTSSKDKTFITQGADEQGVVPHDLFADDLEKEELSQATLLQRKLQQLRDMDQELTEKKEEYYLRIRKVKDGEAMFRKKQEDMRNSIKQFERYILDADNKKNRFLAAR